MNLLSFYTTGYQPRTQIIQCRTNEYMTFLERCEIEQLRCIFSSFHWSLTKLGKASSLPIRIYNPIFLPSHVNFPITCVAPVALHLTTVSTTPIYRITITISQSISHHAGRHQVIIMSNREMDLLCINLHISPRLNGTKPSAQRLLFSYGK